VKRIGPAMGIFAAEELKAFKNLNSVGDDAGLKEKL
jgi:hypothetical protein